MEKDQKEEVNSLIFYKDQRRNESDFKEEKQTFILQDEFRPDLNNYDGHGTQLDKGWAWVVLAASFGAHVIDGGFLYSIGVINNALLKKFNASYTFTSWIGSLFIGLMASTGPFASYLINRYSCRVTTMLGGILICTGCLVSAFMTSIEMVMIMFGFISGVGSGLTNTASVIVIGLNFQKKLNIASGFAVSGAGVGTFIFPSILTLAEINYGFCGLFMVLASFALQQCLFGALYRPSCVEKKNKEEKFKTANSEQSKLQKKRNLSSFLRVLRNKSIMALSISSLSNSIGVYLIVLHLPHYVITKGTLPLNAAFLLTIAGICLCVSRCITGLLGNLECVSEILLYSGSLGILGICTLLFPLYSFTYYGQVIFAVILGMFSGNCYSIYNSINIQLVGESYLAIAYGIEQFFIGVGTTVGPLLAGVIVDNGGTYEQSFLCAGSAILSGSIVGILAKCWNKTKREEYYIENGLRFKTDKSNNRTNVPE